MTERNNVASDHDFVAIGPFSSRDRDSLACGVAIANLWSRNQELAGEPDRDARSLPRESRSITGISYEAQQEVQRSRGESNQCLQSQINVFNVKSMAARSNQWLQGQT